MAPKWALQNIFGTQEVGRVFSKSALPTCKSGGLAPQTLSPAPPPLSSTVSYFLRRFLHVSSTELREKKFAVGMRGPAWRGVCLLVLAPVHSHWSIGGIQLHPRECPETNLSANWEIDTPHVSQTESTPQLNPSGVPSPSSLLSCGVAFFCCTACLAFLSSKWRLYILQWQIQELVE